MTLAPTVHEHATFEADLARPIAKRPSAGRPKSAVKWLANGFATVIVLPAYLLYRLSAAVQGPQACAGWSQFLCLLPGLPGVYLRRAFYRLALSGCGEDAYVGFGTTLSDATASIGRGVYIGLNCSLGAITIEDDVLIASYVSIINGGKQHGIDGTDIPIRLQPGAWPRVTIGTDSWIGERAVVMADVGRHCVVGAGAVVTKPIPDYAIAVGVPAQVVGYRGRPSDSTCPQTET